MRPELPPLPLRMKNLPVDARGYPVPFFVAYVNGVPDHRIVDPAKLIRAYKYKLCMVCGQQLGPTMAFVVGPMCGVNRISSEPPHHVECAEWSVRGCPFMSRPHARRRDGDMPEGHVPAAGNPIGRNPGVMLVWQTRHYSIVRADGGLGCLFQMGEPTRLDFYSEGRRATRAEIDESIITGLPTLMDAAIHEGIAAIRELREATALFQSLLPTDEVVTP